MLEVQGCATGASATASSKSSEVSLGSWLTYGGGVASDRAEACVAKAFEVGINFIDTANVYARGAAEDLLGELLADRPRDTYVLATKLYFPMNGDGGLSRKQVFKQIELQARRAAAARHARGVTRDGLGDGPIP
jgi:aryl-alcohol dehydrogenase-like predicted oxidoreductase